MSFFKETQRSTFTLSWIAQATLFGPLIILFLILVLLPSLLCLDLLFGSIEVAAHAAAKFAIESKLSSFFNLGNLPPLVY